MSEQRDINVETDQERDFETQRVLNEASVTIPAEVMDEALRSEAHRDAILSAVRRLGESVVFTWKPGDGRVRIAARFACANKEHEHVTTWHQR